jgi:hypothetical protein
VSRFALASVSNYQHRFWSLIELIEDSPEILGKLAAILAVLLKGFSPDKKLTALASYDFNAEYSDGDEHKLFRRYISQNHSAQKLYRYGS